MSRTRTILVALLAALLNGCAAPDMYEMLRTESQVFDPPAIGNILRRAPVGPHEDARFDELTGNDRFSAHLFQFRTGQQRHIHLDHDVTFIVHRGCGEVYVRDRRRTARPGDVFHIPRGTPHYCVNTDLDRLVVIAIFTPPFDGHDVIEVPAGARSYPRGSND